MKTILTKDAILKSQDILTREVAVPEWGGVVYVRMLSGKQRDAFEQAISDQRTPNKDVNIKGLRARLCSMTICDDKGAPLFTDADIAALNEKSSRALDRCFDAAQKLNGLTADDVDELVKN